MFYNNYDKWTKESNILLITGVSGSGKTELAKQLQKEYEAIHLELDFFDKVHEFRQSQCKTTGELLIYNYCQENGYPNNATEYGSADIDKFFAYILSLPKDTLIIVEGMHIYTNFKTYEYMLKTLPLIICEENIDIIIQRLGCRHYNNYGSRILIDDFKNICKWIKLHLNIVESFKQSL